MNGRQRHKATAGLVQFGEWAAEGSPTEGHRIAASFRGAYAPLAELDGTALGSAGLATSTPRRKLR
jgi:hypothetical protein